VSQNLCKLKLLVLNILITLLFVAGCGHNNHYAVVRDSSPPPKDKITHHIVAKGETLYSIAWRHNLDYKNLALANGISRDFRIYPGQRLSLREASPPPRLISKKTNKTNKVSPKYSKSTATRSKKETPKITSVRKVPAQVLPKKWVWPARGKLLDGFQSNGGLNKGIDIEGKLEEPVIAAAAGRVVYSGNGLRGYGKLLIVKHSELFLSAYAHNHKLLVGEGAIVKQGQKIAEMGSTGTDAVKLHFEIRHDGKPVNPLKFLPKR